MQIERILLDTDIGSDIDDALALAYLLRHPGCDLMGITTVSGEAERRAQIASWLCSIANQPDVPVHTGAALPLLAEQHQPHAPQAEALPDSTRVFKPDNSALAFLRDTIHRHPGEITLLAIGPLTNIALLFASYPEIPGMLRRFVLMGGCFRRASHRGGTAEWNILCDPYAAAVVFDRCPVNTSLIGLDVTLQCALDAEEARTRLQQGDALSRAVLSLANIWFRNTGTVTFHDPLAAAFLFEPALCRMESAQVLVELHHTEAYGTTFEADAAENRPHSIAVSVDAEAFFEHYWRILATGSGAYQESKP